MFGIGLSEFIVIGIVALLVIGPEKLPGMARTIGRFTWEMRRAWEDVRDTVKEEIAEVREPLDQLRKAGQDTANRFRDETRRMRETAEQTIRDTRKEFQGAVAPIAASLQSASNDVAEVTSGIVGVDGVKIPDSALPASGATSENGAASKGTAGKESQAVKAASATPLESASASAPGAAPEASGQNGAPNEPAPFRRTPGLRGVTYYDLDGNVIE
jgi:sec-independent protein translocase protein TatB